MGTEGGSMTLEAEEEDGGDAKDSKSKILQDRKKSNRKPVLRNTSADETGDDCEDAGDRKGRKPFKASPITHSPR